MTAIRRILARLGFYRPVPGDVVLDRYDGREKTVDTVQGERIVVAYFDFKGLQRASLLRRSVVFVR